MPLATPAKVGKQATHEDEEIARAIWLGMAIADLRSGAKCCLAHSWASSGRFDLSAFGGRVAMSGLSHCLAGRVSVAAGPDSC